MQIAAIFFASNMAARALSRCNRTQCSGHRITEKNARESSAQRSADTFREPAFPLSRTKTSFDSYYNDHNSNVCAFAMYINFEFRIAYCLISNSILLVRHRNYKLNWNVLFMR